MKLITLSGGLGNQLFQFALYLQLKADGEKVFLYKNKIIRYNEHSGYELERLFGVERGLKGLWLTRLLLVPLLGTLLKKLLFPVKLRERVYYDYSVYADSLRRKCFPGMHLVGYWQSERYFERAKADVRRAFRFNLDKVSPDNRRLADEMGRCPSVSLHVRRGDYLSAGFASMYGNLCPVDYYRRAMDYIRERVEAPVYYIFSDEPEWVRENLPLPSGAVLVDWNTGTDSWQDLYLMSCCRHHILANSSFSWWGAWLSATPDACVVAPATWVRGMEAPDVVPSTWIRL